MISMALCVFKGSYQVVSFILEEIDENEIILDDERSATGFPLSLPNVTLSSEFDDLACGTVDHRNVIYSNLPTVAIARVMNTPPPSWNL